MYIIHSDGITNTMWIDSMPIHLLSRAQKSLGFCIDRQFSHEAHQGSKSRILCITSKDLVCQRTIILVILINLFHVRDVMITTSIRSKDQNFISWSEINSYLKENCSNDDHHLVPGPYTFVHKQGCLSLSECMSSITKTFLHLLRSAMCTKKNDAIFYLLLYSAFFKKPMQSEEGVILSWYIKVCVRKARPSETKLARTW